MVIQIQTSFTPKKIPTALPTAQRIGGHGVNLFSILALFIFFAAIGLAVSVFFYKSRLVQRIAALDASLVQAKKSFDPEFIAEASALNARIEGARELLNAHRSLSPLFDILEKKTLESVRFQNFHFSAEGGRDAAIGMIGQAKSFNSVALQSDVFGAEPSFKDPIFSDFSLDERGNVLFNFKTTVDPKLLLYRETLLGERSGETTPVDSLDASGGAPSSDNP
jgi:hypothetical protein